MVAVFATEDTEVISCEKVELKGDGLQAQDH